MRRGFLAGAAGLCVALAALTAHAQAPQIRTIEQGASGNWKHKRSGVVFPAELLGLKREAVQDSTDNEFDVFARYGGDGGIVSVFVYRPAVPSVPLWFDRSHVAVATFQRIDAPRPATIFAPPGSKTASAMRVSYAMPGGAAGTALAVVPVGDWLLKIRVTAKGSPEQVEGQIDAILAALSLPDQSDAPPAAEVQPCGSPLTFGEAAAIKPDGARVTAVAAWTLIKQAAPAGEWCRDEQSTMQWGLYRRAGTSDAYLLALADSGRAVQVEATPPFGDAKVGDFSLTFTNADQIYQFPQISALPSPQRAIALTGELAPVAQLTRSTKTISLMLDDTGEEKGKAGGR